MRYLCIFLTTACESTVISKLKLRKKNSVRLRMAQIQNTDITKCRWGCGATGTLISLLPGTQNAADTWDGRYPCLTKVNILWPTIQQSCSWIVTQRSWKIMSTQNLHRDVYSSFIHKVPILRSHVLQWVNGYINYGASRQWTIMQCSQEMSYQAMERHGGNLNASY